MSDPRDRDFQWREFQTNVVVEEFQVSDRYPLWRWQVRDKSLIVDQRGWWRWLRPMVKRLTLYDAIVAHASRPDILAQIEGGNALFGAFNTKK